MTQNQERAFGLAMYGICAAFAIIAFVLGGFWASAITAFCAFNWVRETGLFKDEA